MLGSNRSGAQVSLLSVRHRHPAALNIIPLIRTGCTASTQVLNDLGYETTWVVNAQEALTCLNEESLPFDVVFTDVVMPGMSGVELGEEIRRRHPGLPVVLTSGFSHVLAKEGQHGFELLKKPYSAEDLSRILRRVSIRRDA